MNAISQLYNALKEADPTNPLLERYEYHIEYGGESNHLGTKDYARCTHLPTGIFVKEYYKGLFGPSHADLVSSCKYLVERTE